MNKKHNYTLALLATITTTLYGSDLLMGGFKPEHGAHYANVVDNAVKVDANAVEGKRFVSTAGVGAENEAHMREAGAGPRVGENLSWNHSFDNNLMPAGL